MWLNKATDMTAKNTELAVFGGGSMVTIEAPSWPIRTEDDALRVADVVRSGHWSWIGDQERAFCEEYARFIGTRFCLCMANGTVTLQCALQAVGVVPGDEVVVPALTWVATAQAALDIGANVVLVDIDPRTLCMDPDAFEAAITPRTKAVVPVHLYGCMCDMDAVMRIARKHDVKVVEDTAHQHGSRWREQSAGAIGHVGSFSFQQSKILTSGEGGAITCRDDEIYRTCFALKQVGWCPDPAVPLTRDTPPQLARAGRYGHNYRITEMQAALLRGGLARLEEQNRRREENAACLAGELARIGGPLQAVPKDDRVTRQAYYAMTLYFDPALARGASREQYRRAAGAEGVRLAAPYDPVYRNPLLNLYDATSPVPYRKPETVQDYRSLNLPNTERAVTQTALLLTHRFLLAERAYFDQVVAAVERINANLDRVRTLAT